ncbi:MAG: hypothetical protein KC417_06780 [Myxococcales bacterium]|nr:hypothetical protein [Myxococcales bacterium]
MSRALLVVLPPVLALVVGLMVVDGEFVGDDQAAIVGNGVVVGTSPLEAAFTTDVWGTPLRDGATTYRPLMPVVRRIEWALGGGSPLPFRIVTVLLHVLAVFFAGRWLRVLGLEPRIVAVVCAVFAVHAANTEAVSALVGQSDIASVLLGLAAMPLFDARAARWGPAVGAFLLLLAVAVKESALLFVLVALVLTWLRPHPRRTLSTGLLVALVVASVAVQLGVPRSAQTTTWNNSLGYDAHGIDRLVLGGYVVGRALQMLLVPVGLAPAHGFAAIDFRFETLAGYAIPGIVLGVLGLVAGAVAIRRRNAAWVTTLMLLFGPVVLMSHWVFPIMSDLPERLLYPACLGAALVLGAAVSRLPALMDPPKLAFLGGAVVAFHLALGFPARRAWRNDDALWLRAITIEPLAVRAQYNASNALVGLGRLDDAAWHRTVAIYLVNSYPASVDRGKLDALAALGAARAWREAPRVLFPESPCPLVVTLLNDAQRIDSAFVSFMLERHAANYPACVRTATP